MADNPQNIKPQATQQPDEKPERVFIQVDTSTYAYMEKVDKNILITPKTLKDS